jgi:hypothetical protein
MNYTRAALALLATAALAPQGAPRAQSGAAIVVRALSTDPALVTGGNVLVELALPSGASPTAVKVTAAGRDVTGAFTPGSNPATLVGLVSGLPNGSSTIDATAGSARGSLQLTGYPITGPVISGPWQQPFVCQTEAYVLPDGSKLGPATDANCSARTVVQHVYLPAGPIADERNAFKPLPNPAAVPEDVAKTTTVSGVTVNFIVRVETGTMNRGIYQNAILHDPTVDPAPTPATPPRGWNRRLIAMHGSGCPGGWYIQGAAQGVNILDPVRLGEGYALFINTLNHPTNSCNAFLAGETTMMGKEHFIETFGVPFYTISVGGSGGAYTSLQVADAFPGLIDGVDIRATFPDALSIALSGMDARLLLHYFNATSAGTFNEAQQVAVSGYHGLQAFIDAANQAQRTDPISNRPADVEGYQSARWNAAVPAIVRYDAGARIGSRPTIFDAARNIYGVNAATGAALRPFDNTGVQYGLAAFNSGVITAAQFLDLNEKIGGFDQDANYIAGRTVGDAGAIRRAYQAGLHLGANGGLKAIPIFDNAASNEEGRYHYGWFHFALRERVRKANGGNADNMVMWRSVSGARGRELFDRWMVAYKSDTSNDSPRTKVLRARPEDGRDGCFDKSEQFVADALPFTSRPASPCSTLYPVYSNPRKEAGGPLAADVLKCQLKPIDAKDYQKPLTSGELARLRTIFPGGVCDWSKPGVNQVPVVTWASFGPSPKNLVFQLARPGQTSAGQ